MDSPAYAKGSSVIPHTIEVSCIRPPIFRDRYNGAVVPDNFADFFKDCLKIRSSWGSGTEGSGNVFPNKVSRAKRSI
jgi:hypothetical protein